MCAGVVTAWALLATVPAPSAQKPTPAKKTKALSSSSAVNDQAALSMPKEKEDSKKSNLEKSKADAAELSALADQLRDELKDMNVNILPLDVLEKTKKLENLARKIKGEANGY